MSEDSPQPTAPQPNSQWQYNPQDTPASPAQAPVAGRPLATPPEPQYDSPSPEAVDAEPEPEVVWTASEFVAHHKDVRWYAAVVGITVVLAIIVRLLTRDNISTAMVLIVGIFFCIGAARKPRVLTYTVNGDGILIGERFYPYSEFRSFSVSHDGAFTSIELIPLKRFMPLTSIYCSPDTEDDALDALADYLPYEERGNNLVDHFARRIRF